MKPKAATHPSPSVAMEDVMTETKKKEEEASQMVPPLPSKVEATATNVSVSAISAMTVAVAAAVAVAIAIIVTTTTILSVADVTVSAIFIAAISQPHRSAPANLALEIPKRERMEVDIFRR